MTKKKIMRYLAFMVLMNLFLPIVSANIPGFIFGYRFNQLLWYVAFLLFYPKLFFSRSMVLVFLYFIIYLILMLLGHYDIDYVWFYRNVAQWLIAISLYTYFSNIESNKIYGKFAMIVLLFLIITTITSIIGYTLFPNAIREIYTGRLSGDLQLFFKKIGIASYGFFSGLPIIIPALVYLIKYVKKDIIINYFIIVIFFYGLITASITAPFLLMILAFIASLMSQKRVKQNILFFIFIVILVIIFPTEYYSAALRKIGEIVNSPVLTPRINALALGMEQGFDVHASQLTQAEHRLSRYSLNWEQFLINPIIGTGYEGNAHIFWMNILAQFGILGLLPIVLIIVNQLKINLKVLNRNYLFFYFLSLFSFLGLGFMKAYSGAELYIYIFFLVPGLYNVKYLKKENKFETSSN